MHKVIFNMILTLLLAILFLSACHRQIRFEEELQQKVEMQLLEDGREGILNSAAVCAQGKQALVWYITEDGDYVVAECFLVKDKYVFRGDYQYLEKPKEEAIIEWAGGSWRLRINKERAGACEILPE